MSALNGTLYTQAQIDRTEAILKRYWKPTLIKEKKSVKDLAEIIHDLIWHMKETVFKDSLKIQCSKNRNRSIQDVYKVAKTYIPSITFKDVVDAVESLYPSKRGENSCYALKLKPGGKSLILNDYCHTVQRVVHYGKCLTTSVDTVRKELGDLNIKASTR